MLKSKEEFQSGNSFSAPIEKNVKSRYGSEFAALIN